MLDITSITTQDSQLRLIPVNQNKAPIVLNWQEDVTTVYDFSTAYGVGLVCGKLSGNIEVLDFDLKHDVSGTIFNEYQKAVADLDPNLLSKMVVQTTMNGGFHFIYRCDDVGPSMKLANRLATEDEKRLTYEKSFQAILEKETAENAAKGIIISQEDLYRKVYEKAIRVAAQNPVVIETRGERGQVVVAPTPGYQFVYGDLSKIQKISTMERSILMDVARTFNEVIDPVEKHTRNSYVPRKKTKGLTPWEDYNSRGDVVQLLLDHGWSYVYTRGSKVMLKRPGDTKAKSSGNYDESNNWFSVFSSSTEFIPNKAYKPSEVFAVLECGNDWSVVAKRLSEMGFGDKDEDSTPPRLEVKSIIDTADDDLSFLSTKDEEKKYLDSWINGTFQMGLSTGMPTLDRHFLFKRGNLVITNGVDNVGKSSVVWFMALLSARLHGWRWIIFSAENNPASVRKRLMEFYWDKKLDKMSPDEFKEAEEFVYSHFDIIKNADNMYNYVDILNMADKLIPRKKYSGLMIDPYNSLKVDAPKGGNKNYDYHYEAASILKLWGMNNDISVYLNVHVGTAGARNVDKNGNVKAPQKADTEMGVMFANKADEFLTIHRNVQHDTEYVFTELHVRKVKETETGGGTTSMYSPVILRPTPGGVTGFVCMTSKSLSDPGENPIRDYLRQNKTVQLDIFAPKNVDFSSVKPTDDDDDAPF